MLIISKPCVWVLFVMGYLDRANIGYIKIVNSNKGILTLRQKRQNCGPGN
jgi:hypothetical protein